jgi:hypothetical protein
VTGAAILTLVGRPDCHLCHEMRKTLERVVAGRSIQIVERNVDDDERLSRLYQLAIPVLLSGSDEIARYSVSEPELASRLAGRGLLP